MDGLDGNDGIAANDAGSTFRSDPGDDELVDCGEASCTLYGNRGNDRIRLSSDIGVTAFGGRRDMTFSSNIWRRPHGAWRSGSRELHLGRGTDTVQEFNPDEGDTVSEVDCENF